MEKILRNVICRQRGLAVLQHLGLLGIDVLVTDVNGIPQEPGLAVPDMEVQHAPYAGKELPDVRGEDIVSAALSIEAHGIDAVLAGNVDGPFILKILTYDGNVFLPENPLNSDHAVQGSEAGIVQIDAIPGHALGNKSLPHLPGFVVVPVGIVSGYHDVADFAGMIKVAGGIDAGRPEAVDAAVHQILGGAQHEAGAVVGDGVYFVEIVGVGGHAGDLHHHSQQKNAEKKRNNGRAVEHDVQKSGKFILKN